ncbi:MAG: hypothetical protein M1830_008959 [Pleopsidium flavum]|nr:MAG: hypothetical protein M1830_008959 [Pleopsidium flavum]
MARSKMSQPTQLHSSRFSSSPPSDGEEFVVVLKDDYEDTWLNPTKYAGEGSEYKKHRTAHYSGTGEWLLESDEYVKWSESPDVGLFLIKGLPSMGKSVIASSFINMIYRTQKAVVVYFFFRQIIETNRQPRSLVIDWLSMGRVFCVADALDEMDPAASLFVDKLAELEHEDPANIKLFVTSRQSDQVEPRLRDPLSIKLKLNRHRIDDDIDVYVRSRASSYAAGHPTYETEVRKKIEQAVRTKSNGVFLYAKLMLDRIIGMSPLSQGELDAELERLPVGLDDLYSSILQEHRRRSGKSQEDQVLVLQWVIHAARPLRLLELANVVNLRQGQKGIEIPQVESKNMVQRVCGPNDFPFLLTSEAHSAIAVTSIHYLSFDCFGEVWPSRYIPKECIWGSEANSLVHHKEKSWNERSGNYPLLNYVADNWARHARKYAFADVDFFEKLGVFLSPISLYFAAWLKFHWLPKCEWERKQNLPANFGPVFVAALFGFDVYLEHLLKTGVSLDEKDDSFRRTPLSYAAENGHLEAVRILLVHGAAANLHSQYGKTPLHFAAEKGHQAVIQVLLAAGVDAFTPKLLNDPKHHLNDPGCTWYVQEGDGKGDPPLIRAIMGNHTSAVEALIKVKPQNEWPEGLQTLSLTLAVMAGHSEMVEVLIDVAKLPLTGLKWRHDTSPLFTATQKNVATVRVLLERGADPDDMEAGSSECARTPMHICAHQAGGSYSGLDAFENSVKRNALAIAEALVKYGANIDVPDSNGITPLMETAKSCTSNPLLSWLLSKGASVNARDKIWKTALHHAGCDDVIDVLLRAGADFDIRDEKGETALMTSYFLSDNLVAAGIDVNAQDNKGRPSYGTSTTETELKVSLT